MNERERIEIAELRALVVDLRLMNKTQLHLLRRLVTFALSFGILVLLVLMVILAELR
jgi:hypothetical protein